MGEHYLAEQWGQRLMTLQQFVQEHLLGSSGSVGGRDGGAISGGGEPAAPTQAVPSAAAAAAPGEPCAASQPAARGYLAQHPLFDQIPALAADIREPLYCCLGEGQVQSINAWFGPAGTVRAAAGWPGGERGAEGTTLGVHPPACCC